jgi:hypothetical protein
LKPIEPGSVFPRDIPAIYIVFESAPLEDPAQFSAQWFLEGEKGVFSSVPLGKDTLEVPGHERYGFLELKKPGDAWPVGTYLVKLFITPLGQQSFHAGNQVGTMRFTIVEGAACRRGPRTGPSISRQLVMWQKSESCGLIRKRNRMGDRLKVTDQEKLTLLYERFRDVCLVEKEVWKEIFMPREVTQGPVRTNVQDRYDVEIDDPAIEDALDANIPRGSQALAAAIQEYRANISFYRKSGL